MWKGERKERRNMGQRDRKQEKKTFLLGDAEFIKKTMRTNCGVGSVTEEL